MKDQHRLNALADFLRTRRARLSPSDVGLPLGSRRKIKGLRREEVAQSANISPTYYTWLEQGRELNISREVAVNIGEALRLTKDEMTYFFRLLRLSDDRPQVNVSSVIPPSLELLLHAQGHYPAYILGRRCDILAWNYAAHVVFGDFEVLEVSKRNMVRYVFTNQAFRQRMVDWEGFAREATDVLRTTSAQSLDDTALTQLVDELLQTSGDFRQWWLEHEVLGTPQSRWIINHPLVGALTLYTVVLHPMGNSDLKVCMYFPPRDDSDTSVRLQLLATR